MRVIESDAVKGNILKIAKSFFQKQLFRSFSLLAWFWSHFFLVLQKWIRNNSQSLTALGYFGLLNTYLYLLSHVPRLVIGKNFTDLAVEPQWPWDLLVIGSLFKAKCEIASSGIQLLPGQSKTFFPTFCLLWHLFFNVISNNIFCITIFVSNAV